MNLKYLFHKICNWEYWPQWLVYAPIVPIFLYYCAKAKSFFFVVATNPNMENGGYIMESKFTIHNQLPQDIVPQTIIISAKEDFRLVSNKLSQSKIQYPFFCKPDIGGKGRGVEKIEDEKQLKEYHIKMPINYLLQAAIPYKNEIGIFYCRFPHQQFGFITGVVGKRNIEIVGDGIHTIKELIEKTPRFYFQRSYLFEKHKSLLNKILPPNETFILSDIGNHSRGSMFIDMSHKNNSMLQHLFDNISKAYNTFYFGRYDVKFNSWEELYEGKNFMIVELNGGGSEPTHIYDPKKNIFQAWKIIIQHWHLMYKIANSHYKNGIRYPSFKEGRGLQKMERKIDTKFN